MMNRPQISDSVIDDAFVSGRDHTQKVIEKHGRQTFASRHELLGIMVCEQRELLKAIQDHRPIEEIRHELLDIMQICAFGVGCIDEDTMDW